MRTPVDPFFLAAVMRDKCDTYGFCNDAAPTVTYSSRDTHVGTPTLSNHEGGVGSPRELQGAGDGRRIADPMVVPVVPSPPKSADRQSWRRFDRRQTWQELVEDAVFWVLLATLLVGSTLVLLRYATV
jgi:hypothetical protein